MLPTEFYSNIGSFVSEVTIQRVKSSEFTYNITYISGNKFKVQLSPEISFPERYKLKMVFKLNSSILEDEDFYYQVDYASVLLKVYEKLSDDDLSTIQN